MIIYGWNSKNIKQADLEAYVCPNCNEKQSVLTIFAHYAHIFWIPLFPFKKTARIVCGHCQLDTEEKSMPEDMKGTIKQLKSAVAVPKSLFSGLVVLALVVSLFTFRNIQNARLGQVYLQNPQIGDVYVIEDPEESSEYNHFLLKVNDIEGDSLWVSFNTYAYNDVVTELDSRDGFYDVMYSLHRNALNDYEDSGELKKIIRDYSSSAGFDRVIEYEEYIEPDSLTVEQTYEPE